MGTKQNENWLPSVSDSNTTFIRTSLKIPRCRFFIHKTIEAFAEAIVRRHGYATEKAFLFPSHPVSIRCTQFLRDQIPSLLAHSVRIVDLYPNAASPNSPGNSDRASTKPIVSAVMFPRDYVKTAKTFWQHSGDGISSRRAEYCYKAFNDGQLAAKGVPCEKFKDTSFPSPSKGPRRYQKTDSTDMSTSKANCTPNKLEMNDFVQFVEERFGRNLDVSLAANAKLAIRRRIAGALTANVDLCEALEISKPPTRKVQVDGFSEDDVYLYPCGMSSIFNTHRALMACKGSRKSISYG